MAEPVTVAAKSATAGAATTTVVGFDPIIMGVGLVASLFSLIFVKPKDGEVRTPRMVFGVIASGAFIAGALVPVAIAGSIHFAPWLAVVDSRSLSWAMAAALGASPQLFPLLYGMWKERNA